MPTIQSNGVELHYISSGLGRDVVMLHGFLGNLAVWHLQIVPRLRRTYRVTTYDLRGHGYSEVTSRGYTCADMALDLKGLLDGLGMERPGLVGHSFGADIALYFALLFPDRVASLAALEPGLACLIHERERESWIGWAHWVAKLREVGLEVPEDKKHDLDFLLQLSLETPKFYGPARGLPRNREPLLRLLRDTTLVEDYRSVGELTIEAVRRIDTKTLLIYGEKSHFISSFEHLRRILPNCRPVLLPGGEHFGPLEQPEMLAELLLEFFDDPALSSSVDERPPVCHREGPETSRSETQPERPEEMSSCGPP